MEIDFKSFIIEILDDRQYSPQSVDNTTKYLFEYSGDLEHKERFQATSKYGIRVKEKATNQEISSAILCETGGATSVHPTCYFIRDDKVWICICDKIYCLDLPSLKVAWCKRVDYATNFSIHPFKRDFIIHGELAIIRMSTAGAIIWRFGGRDIFVSQQQDYNFQIDGDVIKVQDWEGYVYTINEHGKARNSN